MTFCEGNAFDVENVQQFASFRSRILPPWLYVARIPMRFGFDIGLHLDEETPPFVECVRFFNGTTKR